jgi:hypothetical protein
LAAEIDALRLGDLVPAVRRVHCLEVTGAEQPKLSPASLRALESWRSKGREIRSAAVAGEPSGLRWRSPSARRCFAATEGSLKPHWISRERTPSTRYGPGGLPDRYERLFTQAGAGLFHTLPGPELSSIRNRPAGNCEFRGGGGRESLQHPARCWRCAARTPAQTCSDRERWGASGTTTPACSPVLSPAF